MIIMLPSAGLSLIALLEADVAITWSSFVKAFSLQAMCAYILLFGSSELMIAIFSLNATKSRL